MLDPRISLFLGGMVLILVGLLIPSDVDTIQLLTGKLQELNNQRVLCHDSQCVSNIDNSMNYINSSLKIYEFPAQMKVIFFIFGLVAEAGFGISLKAL